MLQLGCCRDTNSGAICRQRASRPASQQATRGACPYLQNELAREAGLRGSRFVNEFLTHDTYGGLLHGYDHDRNHGHSHTTDPFRPSHGETNETDCLMFRDDRSCPDGIPLMPMPSISDMKR